MDTSGNQNMPKICSKYSCTFCNYNTSKKSSYINHLSTVKHYNSVNGNALETVWKPNMLKKCSAHGFKCHKCNKTYMNRSGLWKHNNKCNIVVKNEIQNIKYSTDNVYNLNEPTDKEIIMTLIKENSELKNMMMKVIENGTTNNINNITNNNTNSHNKAFNLNFFLNETCKNAMNISDFVDSIKLQLTDLMEVGELGYVEGISKIIVNKLNSLDETIRPVHCTDKKREIIYIKDEGRWEKDDDNKSILRKSIKKYQIKTLSCYKYLERNILIVEKLSQYIVINIVRW
jgi:hypothetical protein